MYARLSIRSLTAIPLRSPFQLLLQNSKSKNEELHISSTLSSHLQFLLPWNQRRFSDHQAAFVLDSMMREDGKNRDRLSVARSSLPDFPATNQDLLYERDGLPSIRVPREPSPKERRVIDDIAKQVFSNPATAQELLKELPRDVIVDDSLARSILLAFLNAQRVLPALYILQRCRSGGESFSGDVEVQNCLLQLPRLGFAKYLLRFAREMKAYMVLAQKGALRELIRCSQHQAAIAYVKESREEKLYDELLSHLRDANEPNLIRMLQLHPPHLHHLQKNEYRAWKEKQQESKRDSIASAEENEPVTAIVSSSRLPHSLLNPILKLQGFGSYKAEERKSSTEHDDAKLIVVNDEKSLREAIGTFEQHAKSISASGSPRYLVGFDTEYVTTNGSSSQITPATLQLGIVTSPTTMTSTTSPAKRGRKKRSTLSTPIPVVEAANTLATAIVVDLRVPSSDWLGSVEKDLLLPLFARPGLLLTGVEVRSDLALLSRSFESLKQFSDRKLLLDLRSLFQALYPSIYTISLRKLVGFTFGVDLDKTHRMSDWEKRPLSQEQLEYAALDALVAVPIAEQLISELQNRKLISNLDPFVNSLQ